MPFHLLNQTINNEDVRQFLWLLDEGKKEEVDIGDLKTTLSNLPDTLIILREGRGNHLSASIRGFFNYLDFLERFDAFLDSVPDTVQRSAYWYYYEYWFTTIEEELVDLILRFFLGFANARSLDEDVTLDIEFIFRTDMSQKHYLDIVNRLITDTFNKIDFEHFVAEWRGREGRFDFVNEAVVPVV